ncbi:hypothetical protein Barb4_04978 [Bacteroidales bacterium Barb4]|nr:hypothetical protein Barb4_04978 [Bacteroidales bacterium Barb4]
MSVQLCLQTLIGTGLGPREFTLSWVFFISGPPSHSGSIYNAENEKTDET